MELIEKHLTMLNYVYRFRHSAGLIIRFSFRCGVGSLSHDLRLRK